MTTLDLDVADVENERYVALRSPDTRAAIAYLISSGATAISVIENETGCTFKVGAKISPRAAMVFWLPEADAKAVMRKARKLAGRSPDIATAEARAHEGRRRSSRHLDSACRRDLARRRVGVQARPILRVHAPVRPAPGIQQAI